MHTPTQESRNTMKLSDHYDDGKFGLSFELFPPKTEKGELALMRHVERLVAAGPDFITCTYGAGGSTRDKTLQIVREVRERFDCPVASHLTCVGATADQLREYLAEADRQGVDYIVALRGDPPQGETSFRATAGGFHYANKLVAMIHSEFPQFGIAVAGYPETHQEALSAEDDITNLKRKVDAGADVVVTQLFYDNADFYRFRDRCQAAGINVPLVPGLMPVTNFGQIQRITSLCGARLPDAFTSGFAACGEDADAQFAFGVEYTTAQSQDLIDNGAAGLHLYVLNKSDATLGVLSGISRPA